MVSKIIFNLNYQIMEKEPVRVLTLFLCNGTKKNQNQNKTKQNKTKTKQKNKTNREPHRERGYHLKFLFFYFLNHISFLI